MSNMPQNLRFTATHEWLNPEGKEMTVGITNHAQELLGDMVYVELPEIGKTVNAGEEVAVVESVKAASDVYAPISGVISAINQAVSADPAIVNADPYGNGWLFKIKPTEEGETSMLMNVEQYEQVITKDE